ncbi:MAG TPA: acyl-CoA thioesterase [Bacteroidales bacterium]|jgi:acyl-CoA thioester hydrolase|nr:acyl-CoA thioesterase [Bacteroidales bacterium]HRS17892.1 acyl-CoA thioesterase [Bacteroidales bacterium]
MKPEDILQYTFNHAHPIQVRYNDIDLAGHVNNAVYHEFFDLGRTFYFKEVLGEKPFTYEQNIVIAQSNTTYVKEVFLEDELQIVSKIIRFGNKSFDMIQALLRNTPEGAELTTYNLTTFVCMNYSKHEPQLIPLVWKDKITKFEK